MHVEVWSPYKSRGCFLQPHLASGLLWRRGREESTGTPKPRVVETNVAQSAGSKASLADVGLMVPSHEHGPGPMGFQKSSRASLLDPPPFKPLDVRASSGLREARIILGSQHNLHYLYFVSGKIVPRGPS